MRRRIHAFVSVPSWFMGALTLQYFFSGDTDVGDTFIKK